jgi:hypothetical protein
MVQVLLKGKDKKKPKDQKVHPRERVEGDT